MIKKSRPPGNSTNLHALTSTRALSIRVRHGRSKGQKWQWRARLTEEGTVSPSMSFGKNKNEVSLKANLERHSSWGVLEGAEGSELACAAGVALQETHNGRVAFGPSDEFFQGEFSISVGIHLAEDLLCPFLWG